MNTEEIKRNYQSPEVLVLEIDLNRNLLETMSGTEVPTGGQIDDSRRQRDLWDDTPTNTDIWEGNISVED